MFRVVQDQLRVSEGWVRCGQCDEVFDAKAHLQPEGGLLTPVAAPAAARLHSQSPSSDPIAARNETSIDSFRNTHDPHDLAHILDFPAPRASHHARHQQSVEPELEPEPEPVPEPEAPGAIVPAAVVTWGNAADDKHTDEVDASAQHPVPSFVHVRVAASLWDRALVRWGLGLASLALTGALATQILLQERDWIAATQPVTKPWIVAMCQVFHCQVAPLRQIESVVIDSSSFVKVKPDVYRVSFVLKNAGHFGVGTPAVELSLTDTQDQTLVRRVFLPDEFASKQIEMASGGEVVATLSIAATLPGNVARVSGYRLLAFYP